MKMLQSRLLAWFKKNARPLPWRKKYRPYEVWVSEIMLQQTQVNTALPYFRRWMKAFPTIASLAQSSENRVLKLWQGLGYYSRARNLRQSAKLILEKHEGRFPEDYESIRGLKGIGRYTAGAIASIAFNQQKPIVDGNVLRVLSRLQAIRKSIDEEKNKELFWKLEESLIPSGKARYFNQALMELGALVCTAKNPRCGVCPLSKHCRAYAEKNPERYPVRSRKKRMIKVEASALVLSKNGRYLICRRPEGKLMGGLWEFPEWKLTEGKRLRSDSIRAETMERAEKIFKKPVKRLNFLGKIKRNYTRFNETLNVFSADSPETDFDTKVFEGWPKAWVSKKEFGRYPFSSAHSKIVLLITGN
jgi:A/G-specific adenine glycosylase